MKVQVLQHVPFEGLGSIQTWLADRGAVTQWTRFFETPSLPSVQAVDFLIVLGGPMSVNDESVFPWLASEKQFIQQVIAADKPVLGICLGAQLIANAMGARVYPNARKEIGWFDVEQVGTSGGHFLFPQTLPVFHWHGETFDLPPGAIHLARSAACAHQAFQLGERVIGLQFHLETTPDSAMAMIAHCGDELIEGPFVQSAVTLQAVDDAAYRKINVWMARVLDYLNRP